MFVLTCASKQMLLSFIPDGVGSGYVISGYEISQLVTLMSSQEAQNTDIFQGKPNESVSQCISV